MNSGTSSKVRITVVVGANMIGTEKLPLLVIGKSANPRCFKGLSRTPIHYECNKTSWMTSDLFVDWVKKVNRTMIHQDRKILLVVDNCPSHPQNTRFSNVELLFLPANTTSVLQPMDQGVIRSLKSRYRQRLMRHIIRELDAEKGKQLKDVNVNLLHAMLWTRAAWDEIPESVIRNCFRKSGFPVPGVDYTEADARPEENEEVFPEYEEIEREMEDYRTIDDDIRVHEENKDEEKADETGDDESLYDCEVQDLERPSHAEVLQALEVVKKYSLFEDIHPNLPLGIAALDAISKTVESNRTKAKKQTTLSALWK